VCALAELGPTGVDEQTAFCVRHRAGGFTTAYASLRTLTPWEASVSGELGHIRLEHPFYCPARISVVRHHRTARTIEVPVLGNGYAHQAIEVARCLREGHAESPVMPLDESVAIMRALDDIRAQVGLRYPGE